MGKDHGNILAWMRKKWFLWFLKVGIMGLIMFANVTSEDQIGVPSTNTLCISDCATCPVICSPSPPLLQSHPPPSPPVHHSQPRPRPPPLEASAPKASSYSSVQPPPPPPYKYFNNMPPGPGTPPTTYPHDYSYPYYYFYASKASYLSLDASFFFMSLSLSFCVFLLVSKSRMQFVPWENI
ncbi:extensin-2-like [Juglans microcarpa x Juglans regia]|uniref:extensin-2-like n=1 Tax=Juglans microcarpa x Juglans regia TaxID=2249226 RepID=UPI001B7F3A7D|nr:extensin-2-like [Juglans microcarpa x Juglans regia]